MKSSKFKCATHLKESIVLVCVENVWSIFWFGYYTFFDPNKRIFVWNILHISAEIVRTNISAQNHNLVKNIPFLDKTLSGKHKFPQGVHYTLCIQYVWIVFAKRSAALQIQTEWNLVCALFIRRATRDSWNLKDIADREEQRRKMKMRTRENRKNGADRDAMKEENSILIYAK